MESSGRALRSRTVVPAKRSPTKASTESRKKKAAKNKPKADKVAKNAGSQSLKASKLAAAMMEAQEYLADNSEEEFVKESSGKRARKQDQEGELMSAADVAEANRRAMKAMEDDVYGVEAEERLSKVAEDIIRYEKKTTMAKERLKGHQLRLKLDELKAKLDSLYKMQSEIKAYIKNREEELLNATLKEVMKEKHSKKRRHVASEDSEVDELEVSDGEYISDIFHEFSRFLHSFYSPGRSLARKRSFHTDLTSVNAHYLTHRLRYTALALPLGLQTQSP